MKAAHLRDLRIVRLGDILIGIPRQILVSDTALGVVLSLRQLRDFDPVWLAALNHLVTAIALAPFVFVDARLPSGMQWVFLAGLGIVQMAIPYVLFAYSVTGCLRH